MEIKFIVKKIDGDNVILENQSNLKTCIVPGMILPAVKKNDVVTIFTMIDKRP